MKVVVARGTEELVETLALVRGWLFGLTLLSLLAASGVALLVVSRGLRSTRALGADARTSTRLGWTALCRRRGCPRDGTGRRQAQRAAGAAP